MRVAVLGGGMAGVMTALELAERGCRVELFEAESALITRASYWNEGKIHLGYVYAKDKSVRSAVTMLRGALQFRSLVCRWVDERVFDSALSTPFLYAVHRDSMLAPEEVEAHFNRVAEHCSAEIGKPASRYLTPDNPGVWRRLTDAQRTSVFDPELIVAAYETGEYCIDPQIIAGHLRDAVSDAPGVTVHTGHTIEKVTPAAGAGFEVHYRHRDFAGRETCDAVVNALWQNRLGVDEKSGWPAERNIMHRYKIGLHANERVFAETAPSVTFVTGPFGDLVNYGHRAFISWYPAGHVFTSRAVSPPPDPRSETAWDDAEVERKSLDAMARLVPSQSAGIRNPDIAWRLNGCYITAWGETGVDDPASQLHERYEVGVTSRGAYHSLDTGKYTLAPLFAEDVCDRIKPRRRTGFAASAQPASPAAH